MDATPDRTLVNGDLYFPFSQDTFLYLDDVADDTEEDYAWDDLSPSKSKRRRRKGKRNNQDEGGDPGAEGGGDPEHSRGDNGAGKFHSDIDPLKPARTIRIVAADPPNACQPLKDSYNPDEGEAIIVLVRKEFGSRHDCLGEQSLVNVDRAGAQGAILYWADTSQLVQSGSERFAGRAFPAFTIGSTLGELMWDEIRRGTEVLLDLLAIYDDEAPFENIAGYSAFGSAAPWDKPVTTSYEEVDVRIKPELVAPGRVLSASTDRKITGQLDQCAVEELQGTSMAAPVIAGAAAIVRQYFIKGFYPTGARTNSSAHYPSAPLVKAVLLAGAAAMKGISIVDARSLDSPPSIYQGYGRVDLSGSLPLAGDERGWKLQVVDGARFEKDGLEHTYTVVVPRTAAAAPPPALNATASDEEDANSTASSPLIVTLAWNDYPAFPGTFYALVNNLDLVVYGPPPPGSNATADEPYVWWGNKRHGGDYQNNVERVFIRHPTPGTYTISVRAAYLFSRARPQPYALVALGGFAGELRSPHNPAA